MSSTIARVGLLDDWGERGSENAEAASLALGLDRHLRMLWTDVWALEQTDRPDDTQLFALDEAAASELASRVAQGPHEHGVLGFVAAGLWLTDASNPAVPALFVDRSLALANPSPLERAPGGALAKELRFPGIDRVWAVGVEPATPYAAAPGVAVTCAGRKGTFGCRVTLGDGANGITTAGHAARAKGSVIKVQGARVGLIESSAYLDATAVGQECADLAVVRLDASPPEAPGPCRSPP